MSRSLVALCRELGRRMNTLEKQMEVPINSKWPRQRWKLAWPIHRTISTDLQALGRIPVPFHIFHKMVLERTSVNQSGWEPNLGFVWNDWSAANLGHQHFRILDLMSFGPNDIFPGEETEESRVKWLTECHQGWQVWAKCQAPSFRALFTTTASQYLLQIECKQLQWPPSSGIHKNDCDKDSLWCKVLNRW